MQKLKHLMLLTVLLMIFVLPGCSTLQNPAADAAAKGVMTYGIIKLIQADEKNGHAKAAADVALIRSIGDSIYQFLGNPPMALTLSGLSDQVDKVLATQNLKPEDIVLIQSVRPLVDQYIVDLLSKAKVSGIGLNADDVAAIRQAMREFDSTFTIMGYPRAGGGA